MRITFILKNLTDQTLCDIKAMDGLSALTKLTTWAFGDLRHLVSVKYGTSNAFRDRVDANTLIKSGCNVAFKIEPRKGYKLATFTLSRA